MTQNFSNMSDIYIPELMELDSYWQKAVEDAICDTLKGEKRLHYALRNRKKINQKLESLGLRRVHTQLRLSNLFPARVDSTEEHEVSESGSDRSLFSLEDGSQEAVDPDKSSSRSRNNGDTPFEKKHKSPDRPLLGNGSLEKMKKSQNSFNCEPMGMENLNEEFSESEKDDEIDFNEPSKKGGAPGERNKKIQWLHVRDDSDFEESDSEALYIASAHEGADQGELHRHAILKDRNYYMNDHPGFRLTQPSKQRETSKISKMVNPKENLLRGSEVKSVLNKNTGLERRLQLALAKRDILSKNLKTSRTGRNKNTIEINHSAAKVAEKRRKGKKHLSPFIRFYLEVYRELCHKLPVKRITEEAARRWRCMSKKQKTDYAKLRHKK